jgi:arginine N-succinyltransferase
MVFIRPAAADDVEPLVELARGAGVGLTTLPSDRELLAKRVAKSLRSFQSIPERPGGESYLLVMEDSATGRVVGASGIVSKVGGFEPFYGFEIRHERHHSDVLGVSTEVPYLQLVSEHDGPCEIGSLYLHPDYRKRDNGRLLQLVRFLFAAEHRPAFEDLVVSELRGVIDPDGSSPFWDAVGRHFFDIDFPRADHLSVVNKRFIADLMPRHPIYIPLLPQPAQQVIGVAHTDSRPAMRNLGAEGFRFGGIVDIFDAGPCVSCKLDDVRTVRKSRVARVAQVGDAAVAADQPFMIGTRGQYFRAACGAVEVHTGAESVTSVTIERAVAKVLNLDVGSEVRIAPLRPPAADAAVGTLEYRPREREGSD